MVWYQGETNVSYGVNPTYFATADLGAQIQRYTYKSRKVCTIM